jgi:broad specificity phosphatase PhoE
MSARIRYLTHPQVRIDPHVNVPDWGLSEIGRRRVQALVSAGWLAGTTQVIASAERKAIETAEPICAALGVVLEIREAMHENDRSATGFLAPPEFERVADDFFARPHESVRGWERAVDAQARIVRDVEAVLARGLGGDVLFVGHGGVGTLLLCHLAKHAIARTHDQQASGGNYFSFTRDGRVLHAWRPIEEGPG